LIAERELKKSPGAPIIYNLICSRVVPEVVSDSGGVPMRSRVGHSYIKKMMAENNAVFGGEHSGHFYFKDFWCADSGMLAALHTIAALFDQQKPLSQLLTDFNKYALSGEINTKVSDQRAAIQIIKSHFVSADQSRDESVTFDELDGLTVSTQRWSFNVRPSNTEPLLRLNVEAITHEEMLRMQDLVLRLIRSG
jgi:phosphomannomutase